MMNNIKNEKYGYKVASKEDVVLNKDPEILQDVLDIYHEMKERILEEAKNIEWQTLFAIIPFSSNYGFVQAYYDVREQKVEKISWSVFLGLNENDDPIYCPYEIIF